MEEHEHLNNSEEVELTEHTLLIKTEDIADFLFNALPDFGLVPTEDEVNLLADLFFDYLVHISFIDDYEEY